MEKKILKEDFIGHPVEVDKIHGTITDETKNMLIVKTDKGMKKITKKDHTFIIHIAEKKYSIQGQDIMSRPEERIKLR